MLHRVASELDKFGDEIIDSTKELPAGAFRNLREHLLKDVRDRQSPSYDIPCGLQAIDNWK